MGVSGAGARRKGHNFEREVATEFRLVYGPDVRRGLQYQDGTGVPDVVGTRFHIECKRGKKTNIKAAMEQAIADGWTYAKRLGDHTPKTPLVITKDDNEESLATMRLEDLLTLLKELQAYAEAGPQG
jgi:Holliday junction resolvase